MNYTLNWDSRERAIILSVVYPFEISSGVQRESFEIYTKFQGYRALQAVLDQCKEHHYVLSPEEIFLLWKDIQEKIFFSTYHLQIFTDDDLVDIHERISGARKDPHEIKKMRVRTFLRKTVEEELCAAINAQRALTKRYPNNTGHAAPKRGSPIAFIPQHT